MPKRFVLDTNVLLHDPTALERFGDAEILIPIYAIEEIDRFKRELSERGRNARVVSRKLDALRQNGGNLAGGVATKSGGSLRVVFVEGYLADPSPTHATGRADDLILAVALQERNSDPEIPVVFVTRDVNLRIRADAMGLDAENYVDERVDMTELYSGATEIDVTSAQVDAIYAEGKAPYEGLISNQYAVAKDATNARHSALVRFNGETSELQAVLRARQGVWGVSARNKEQRFALDALLHDEIKLVTLVGKAGTGKTLLAIAAGLQKVVEERCFRKLLVSRPIFPLGRDVGFLPGDVEAKLNPWMQPIYDNLEFLLGMNNTKEERREQGLRQFLDLGYVEVEPLTYIRGRSIPNQYMIVDEAQNLTPHEVKTIITRVGDDTKIVLTGDPYQIDNPYVDSSNNGLSTVVERFKGQKISAHVTLFKGERSELAELAADVL